MKKVYNTYIIKQNGEEYTKYLCGKNIIDVLDSLFLWSGEMIVGVNEIEESFIAYCRNNNYNYEISNTELIVKNFDGKEVIMIREDDLANEKVNELKKIRYSQKEI